MVNSNGFQMQRLPGTGFDGARLLLQLVVAILLGLSVYHFYCSVVVIREKGFIDLPLFLKNLGRYFNTGVLYPEVNDLTRYSPGFTEFKFPPIYMVPFVPFFDGSQAGNMAVSRFYWLVSIVMYIVGCGLIIKSLADEIKDVQSKALFIGLCTSICFLYVPFFEMLFCLSFEGILHLAIAILAWSKIRRLPFLSGGIIALVSMMKIYPAILLVQAITRDVRNFIAGFIAVSIILLALSLLVFGAKNNLDFYTRILPVLLKEKCSSPGDLSFSLCGSILDFPGVMNLRAISSGWIFSLDNFFSAIRCLFMGYGIYFLVGQRHSQPEGVVKSFLITGFVTCTMFLYTPNTWGRYQVVLLLPILTIIASYFSGCMENKRSNLFSFIVSFCVVVFVFALIVAINGRYELLGNDYYSLLAALLLTAFFFVNSLIKLVDRNIFILTAGLLSSVISRDFWVDFNLWYFNLWAPDFLYHGQSAPLWLPGHLAEQFRFVRVLFPVGIWMSILEIARKNQDT